MPEDIIEGLYSFSATEGGHVKDTHLFGDWGLDCFVPGGLRVAPDAGAPDVKASAEAVLVQWDGSGPYRLSRNVHPNGFIDDVYRFVGKETVDGEAVLVEVRERTYKGLIILSRQYREETIDRARDIRTVLREFFEARFEYRDLEEIYAEILAGGPVTLEINTYSWEETIDCPIEADRCAHEPNIRDFQKKVFRQEWKTIWHILGEEMLNTNDGSVPVLALERTGIDRRWYSPRRHLIIKQSRFMSTRYESIDKVPLGDETGGIIRRDGKPF